MKTAVFICITGDYDIPSEFTPEPDFDYYCFTNNSLIQSSFWNVIYIDEPYEDALLQRKVKILSYQYLPDYELLIYLDANMEMRAGLRAFLEQECDLDHYDVVCFRHHDRDCIYQEMNACVTLYKEKIENIRRLERFYRDEKYPEHNGLTENTVLVRKNKDNVNRLMDDWFRMIEQYSCRDQLTFYYCLQKQNAKLQIIDLNVFDNPYFARHEHIPIKTLPIRFVFDNQWPFDYHAAVDKKIIIGKDYTFLEQTVLRDTEMIKLFFPEPSGLVLHSAEAALSSGRSCGKIQYSGFKTLRGAGDNYFAVQYSYLEIIGDFRAEDTLRLKLELKRYDWEEFVSALSDETHKYRKLKSLTKDLLLRYLGLITGPFARLGTKFGHFLNRLK